GAGFRLWPRRRTQKNLQVMSRHRRAARVVQSLAHAERRAEGCFGIGTFSEAECARAELVSGPSLVGLISPPARGLPDALQRDGPTVPLAAQSKRLFSRVSETPHFLPALSRDAPFEDEQN